MVILSKSNTQMIAVLTPTLDWPNEILELAQSLRHQTCQKFEWYVESPTHPSTSLLTQLKDICWPSKIVIANDNGIYQAFNILQAAHNCSHSVFINDTDYLSDDGCIERWIRAIQRHPDSFITSPVSVIDCEDNLLSHNYLIRIYRPNKAPIPCNHPGLIHPTNILRSMSYPEHFKIAGDLAFLYSAIHNHNVSVKHMRVSQVCFRLGGASSKYYQKGLQEKVVLYFRFALLSPKAWFDIGRSLLYMLLTILKAHRIKAKALVACSNFLPSSQQL